MEAKDLMINDLVSVSGTPMRVACIGTTKVGFRDAKGGIFFHLYEEVKPIPTTDDFLEKNGWVADCDGKVFKKDGVFIMYHKMRSKFFIAYKDDHLEEPQYDCIADVSEVHKFQHALKVLGIEQKVMV